PPPKLELRAISSAPGKVLIMARQGSPATPALYLPPTLGGDTEGGATVRERLWLWGHDAGAHNDGWGLPGPSRITAVEAAFYLDIPNLIMVRYKGHPPLPLDQYAVPLRALRRVVWSAVGAHGQTDEEEQSHVLDLAARHPNVTGVMLDDFFVDPPCPPQPVGGGKRGGEPAALSLDQLRELRGRLRGMPTPPPTPTLPQIGGGKGGGLAGTP